jgi:predicted GNAT family acetyltransferase
LDPTPKVTDNPDEGRFELHLGDELAGFSVYELRDGGATYAFTHTEVDEKFEGHGLGSKLAAGMLDELRAKGAAVLPYCPFVRAWIRRHPDYRTLVPESDWAYFKLTRPDSGE